MLDLATLKADIQKVEEFAAIATPFIPGTFGDTFRNFVNVLEHLADNPVLLDLVVAVDNVVEGGFSKDSLSALLTKVLDDLDAAAKAKA